MLKKRRKKTTRAIIAYDDASPRHALTRTTVAAILNRGHIDPFELRKKELREIYDMFVARRGEAILHAVNQVLTIDPSEECEKHPCIPKDANDWVAIDNNMTAVFADYMSRVAERTEYLHQLLLNVLVVANADLHEFNKIELEMMSQAMIAMRLILTRHFQILHETGRTGNAMEHSKELMQFVKDHTQRHSQEAHGKDTTRRSHRRNVRSRSTDQKVGSCDEGSKASKSRVGNPTASKIRERIH